MATVAGQATTDVAVGSPTWNINVPSGTTAGDLLLVIVTSSSATQFATAASRTGWTTIVGTNETGGADTAIGAAYKIADSTDAAASNLAFTIGAGSPNAFGTAVMLRITGYHTGALVAQSNSNAITSSGTSHVTASITPTTANNLIIAAYSCASTSVISWTPPGTMTEIFDHAGGDGTTNATMEIATETLVTPAAITRTATLSTSDSGVNMIFGIPASQVFSVANLSGLSGIIAYKAPIQSIGGPLGGGNRPVEGQVWPRGSGKA